MDQKPQLMYADPPKRTTDLITFQQKFAANPQKV